MQGMYQQKRQIMDHVEYETQGWLSSFYVSHYFCKLLENISEAFAPTSRKRLVSDFEKLVNAIQLTLAALDSWSRYESASEMASPFTPFGMKQYPEGFKSLAYISDLEFRVLEYHVDTQPVSLHTTLHWVLSSLVSYVPMYLNEIAATYQHPPISAMASLHSIFSFEKSAPTSQPNALLPKPFSLEEFAIPIPKDPYPALDACIPDPDISAPFNDRLSREDRLSRIVDYVFRSEVFLSQIRLGLWVRNGQSMRSQYLHFKHLFLRDLYELNVFVVQMFSVLLGADRFLLTLMDRFGLVKWFSGLTVEAAKETKLDHETLIGLAEDFLGTVIYTLSERSRPTGMSVEMQIRREMIHQLAVAPSGLQYSKLQEFVSDQLVRLSKGFAFGNPETTHEGSGDGVDRMEGIESIMNENVEDDRFFEQCKGIDEWLSELATFKFPENLAEKGVYELKDEFYDEVDPWYYKFTRTQREDMENILLSRLSKKRGSMGIPKGGIVEAAVSGSFDKEVGKSYESLCKVSFKFGVRPPVSVYEIPTSSGFAEINNIVSSATLCKILFFGLVRLRL
jgi:E3 ubiquitin-protein ligase UBR1